MEEKSVSKTAGMSRSIYLNPEDYERLKERVTICQAFAESFYLTDMSS